jgi:phage terminase large subunit-like protein
LALNFVESQLSPPKRKKRGRPIGSKTRRKQTRAERNIEWCEDYLKLPEGKFVGQRLCMADFMKDDFKAIYDNKVPTRRAIISRGRKNAKSTETAMMLLLHLCGPEHKINSQIYSCAQSRDQAALVFSLAAKMVRMSPQLRSVVTIRDTAKELLCSDLGTFYKALSADASTAFGRSPVLTIFDELGQVRGPRSNLYEAMETATAAQEHPLTVIISTQAPTDADLLSILIDDAKAGYDQRTVLRLNIAPMDVDPFAIETIRLANPAFDVFMNAEEVTAMADDARRMPTREPEFRNLVLNQRVEASSPFVAPMLWKACGDEPMDLHGREVYCGLDLSATADLTALILIGRDLEGIWHAHSTFWLPGEGLADKSRADRVPYDEWRRTGFLQVTPGASVDYEYVARYLYREVFQQYRVIKIAFDRWNFKHLKPWLTNAGFSEQQITDHFVEFGQGTQSMSPALRELESIILDRRLRHGNHPVLTMCAANAVTEGTDASNRKLSKKRSSGRIDGMVALAMAIGVAPLKSNVIDVRAMIG